MNWLLFIGIIIVGVIAVAVFIRWLAQPVYYCGFCFCNRVPRGEGMCQQCLKECLERGDKVVMCEPGSIDRLWQSVAREHNEKGGDRGS